MSVLPKPIPGPAEADEPAALHGSGAALANVLWEPPLESEALDLIGAQSCVDETAYVWDLDSDRMDWEANAAIVLGVDSLEQLRSGQLFHAHLVPEHVSRRVSLFDGRRGEPSGRGTPYRLQYRFRPQGLRGDTAIWLEDHGRWWPGRNGRPARVRGVIRIVDEAFVAEQTQLYGTDRDELTGQLNRIRLTEALEAVIERGRITNTPSALLIVSVNNLSVINETFGFDVGDEVLAATARVIKEKLRGGDTLGRYSSNKFGIILNECGAGAMRIAAERFMKAVRSTALQTSACQMSATISVGGVALPEQAATVKQAISHGLQALDQARSRRFDSFVGYSADEARESTRRRNITVADEVMSALDDNRMRLVLQPIISTRTGEPEFYECLLRMQRPDGTIVSAGEFIPVAEQLGLARLIDRRTLEMAAGLLETHPELKLTVNVSSLTATCRDWTTTLHRLIAGRRRMAERLVVELTETSVIDDIDQAVAFVDTLKELGCRVAIDDFGAGYTSFKNLKHLPVDMVKIDGAFVKNLTAQSSDLVFIRTMVELADTFGMETVAEWVGDAESARLLTEAGITYLQGFHYGQPISVEELAARCG